MSDDTKLYISIQSRAGQLVIDGPMVLWRELISSLGVDSADLAVTETGVLTEPDRHPEPVR
jgi:hypothetical protein